MDSWTPAPTSFARTSRPTRPRVPGGGARRGRRPALAINPDTPTAQIADLLPVRDDHRMGVRPGFAGQSSSSTVEKIESCALITAGGRPVHLQVDGGVGTENIARLVAAGADVIVSGSFVFRHPQGYAAALRELRACG